MVQCGCAAIDSTSHPKSIEACRTLIATGEVVRQAGLQARLLRWQHQGAAGGGVSFRENQLMALMGVAMPLAG